MNPKQARFVREYLIDLNGTQAAIRAGYSENSAAEQASDLLRVPKIAERIAKGKQRYADEAKLSASKVLRELKTLAFSSIEHYEIDDEGHVRLADGAPANAMAAISSIERTVTVDKEGGRTYNVKLKFWDKPGALKLAGRHVDVKGFSDRTEITGKNGGPIMIAPMTAEQAAAEIAALEAKARGELPAIDVTPIEPKKESEQ